MDGLFCERIFGPSKSLECACGKYKRVRYDGLICERCGVELTESRVRRHRMGHINLIYPVTHVWYTNSRPNYMALLLEVEQCEKRIDTGLLYYLPDIFTLINTNLEYSKNPEVKELPLIVNASISFKPIYDFLPQIVQNTGRGTAEKFISLASNNNTSLYDT